MRFSSDGKRRNKYGPASLFDLNADNMEREINGLVEALTAFNLKEGTIVTFNQEDTISKNGYNIHIKPASQYFQKQNIFH